MSWIDRLDEHGYNVVIDELAWHLREGREPSGVVKRLSPEPGVEFDFPDRDGTFLKVIDSILDLNWREAKDIVRQFPQLLSFEFREPWPTVAAEPAAVGRPGASASVARPSAGAFFRSSTRRAVAPGG